MSVNEKEVAGITHNLLIFLVGARGLEPPASWSQRQIEVVLVTPSISQQAVFTASLSPYISPYTPLNTPTSVPLQYRSRRPALVKATTFQEVRHAA